MKSEALSDAVRKAFGDWSARAVLEAALNGTGPSEAYLAGGFVRDVASGQHRPTGDVDLFCTASRAERVLHRLAADGRIETGPFGAPRWTPSTEDTYVDIVTIEHFTNGLWSCEDMKDALNQFDFTANAIAFDLVSGEVLDPQNGIRDAGRRVMRAVRFDYPNEPIAAGGALTRPGVVFVRIVHYLGRLGFTVDSPTRDWLLRNLDLCSQIEEFQRTFFQPDTSALDRLMIEATAR